MTIPNAQLQGYDQAQKTALANMSPRYRRLDDLEKWVDGTQYKGRPDWFTGGPSEVPLWEREPCVVYPVVQIAAQSNTDLCLSEARFPRFVIGEATEAAPTDGKPKASPVDAFLTRYHTLARFAAACREALTAAQGCGTVVALQGTRNGKPFIELQPAKWCTPEDGADGELERLTIQYPYLDERKQSDGTWSVEAMLYRRVIDRQRDVVFKPQKADAGGRQPSAWEEDASKSVDHGLGFVPAVWYAFMRGCQPVNVIDGKAIHQWITDEIQAHDIARSQWHRGALYSEPQITEVGVQPGHNPTDVGRTAMVPTTEHGGPITPDNPITGGFLEAPATRSARKRGPGHIWQYPSENTKVDVLEYSAGALKAQQDNCSDLRLKIQESLCVVFLDAENVKLAATSGKALKAIKERQVDRCATYRDDFRDGFLVPCIKMQIRLARKLGEQLKVKGLKEALAALGTEQDIEVETVFGSFFTPDPEEQLALIELIATAVEKGLLDSETAIERAAQIFVVQDVEALKQRIERDRIARQEREVATLKRWSDSNGGSGVSGDPATLPKGRARGRAQDGEDDAGQAGD